MGGGARNGARAVVVFEGCPRRPPRARDLENRPKSPVCGRIYDQSRVRFRNIYIPGTRYQLVRHVSREIENVIEARR